MEMNMGINTRVRLNTGSGRVEGRLACIERNEDDSIFSIMIRTLAVTEIGSLYFTAEDIEKNGWILEDISAEPFGMEAAVVAYLN